MSDVRERVAREAKRGIIAAWLAGRTCLHKSERGLPSTGTSRAGR